MFFKGVIIVKQVVYVDILLTTNLFINYFLLLSCAKLMKAAAKRLRLLCGAALGAVMSLVIFLPAMGFVSGLLFKLCGALAIVFAAFGAGSLKRFLKLFFAFMGANFIFAGSMMALWIAFEPGGMVINNNIVYFDISVPVLIISAVICYGIVAVISRVISRRSSSEVRYSVTVAFDSLSVAGKGYLDTGNSLTECFSGFPVIIANEEFVKGLFFSGELTCLKGKTEINGDEGRLRNRVRIIPFGTIKENGILKAFRPDYIIVEKDGEILCKTKDVYIAVEAKKFAALQCDVLLNPKVFESKEI